MSRALLGLLAVLLIGTTGAPQAAVTTRPLDPAHSLATFSVRKFWFAHAYGRFPGLQGALHDSSSGSGHDLLEVTASIDVNELQMDDAGALRHALGPKFFDAAHYPLARFQSDPFPPALLVSGGTLHGLLLLHGERQPVAFVLAPSECPQTPLACVLRVSGSLSRAAFGMHGWRGLVGDKVELSLRIRLLTP